jgi:energy-coupling factor transporter transmembrane protein EcfT
LKKVDPRIRVILGILTVVMVLLTQRRWLLAVEFGALLGGLLVLSRARELLSYLRISGPMVAVVVLVGWVSFSWQDAMEMGLRFMALFLVSFLLFQSLTVEELAQALKGLGVPWSFCFILATAMRYVSLLGRKLKSIVDAQRSRGIDLRPRLRNIPNLMALAVPFLVQSFQLSEDLAVALEARGFVRKVERRRPPRRITLWEYGLVVGWIVLTFVVAYLGEDT